MNKTLYNLIKTVFFDSRKYFNEYSNDLENEQIFSKYLEDNKEFLIELTYGSNSIVVQEEFTSKDVEEHFKKLSYL